MTIASATGSADTGLAAALRHDTRAAHTRAEESVFIQRLITGTLPLSAYVALTAQNLAIYTALEELGEIWRDDPVAGPFLFEELRRVPRLRYDLEYMLGPDWPDLTRELVVPASHCYVAHLHDVGPRWPAGYVAHHYVRYLGDLAGGQVIRSAIQRSYATDEKLAVTFYIFESIEKVKPFRDRYRWLLDAMPIGDDEQAQVIAEANTAFELNRAVFEDLAERHCPRRPSDDDRYQDAAIPVEISADPMATAARREPGSEGTVNQRQAGARWASRVASRSMDSRSGGALSARVGNAISAVTSCADTLKLGSLT